MLRVDKGRCAAALLGLCNGVERERCLARAFGAIDFDNSATGQATNTKRDVEAQRAGGNCLDLHLVAASQIHGGAFAKSAINLRQRGFASFLSIHIPFFFLGIVKFELFSPCTVPSYVDGAFQSTPEKHVKYVKTEGQRR